MGETHDFEENSPLSKLDFYCEQKTFITHSIWANMKTLKVKDNFVNLNCYKMHKGKDYDQFWIMLFFCERSFELLEDWKLIQTAFQDYSLNLFLNIK